MFTLYSLIEKSTTIIALLKYKYINDNQLSYIINTQIAFTKDY